MSLALLTGCGAMLSGTTQDVQLRVNPPGSQVSVFTWTGEAIAGPGISPGVLNVHRPRYGQPYLVLATMPGHCPQYWVTANRLSPGGWGTALLFNGIIPLSIDRRTGGLYSIEPDPVAASLNGSEACPE